MVISAVSVPSGRVLGVEVVRTKDELQPGDRPQGSSEVTAAPAALAVQTTPAAPAPTAVAAGPAAAPQAPRLAQVESAPNPSTKPKKENEIPAARRLLARIPITGRLVSLDAMHTQHQTAGQIVLDAGADYLLTLKDNQPTLTQTAQTLVPSAFFPSGPRGKEKTHGPNGGEKP
jgi:hypothetical protein